MAGTGKVLASNRQARHRYLLLETFEAGISLLGPEVKSLREGRAQLREAYVEFKAGRAWLVGSHISPWRFNTHDKDLDPLRRRTLLLHRKEIERLGCQVQQKGLTVIPLAFITRRGWVKLRLALAKGKDFKDKRETLKKRALERDEARNFHGKVKL